MRDVDILSFYQKTLVLPLFQAACMMHHAINKCILNSYYFNMHLSQESQLGKWDTFPVPMHVDAVKNY
jgi:hypothetical protein